MNMRENKNVC